MYAHNRGWGGGGGSCKHCVLKKTWKGGSTPTARGVWATEKHTKNCLVKTQGLLWRLEVVVAEVLVVATSTGGALGATAGLVHLLHDGVDDLLCRRGTHAGEGCEGAT